MRTPGASRSPFSGFCATSLATIATGLALLPLVVAGSIPGVTRTLAVAIYSDAETGRDAEAVTLLLISSAIAFAALWASNRLVERRAA